MKIYKTQIEMEKDVVDGVLKVNESVTFEFSFNLIIRLIIEGDINAWDIKAGNINAWDINARNINARDINAGDINAWDIKAGNINAWDINARDIKAGDIKAGDINAWDILYYTFCCVYSSIKCISIKGKRKKHNPPICLDGELTIKTKSIK